MGNTGASLPDPAGPAKLYTRQAHLAVLVGQLEGPRGCLWCRRPFPRRRRRYLATCERCGVVLGCFRCYLRVVARGPRERTFFAQGDPDDRGLDVLLLCAGCRS